MWVAYMQDILDLNIQGRNVQITPASHGAKLTSADYHGAEVEVVRSRCSSRVGVKGIVVRDTKFVFDVVTEKDEFKSESCCLGWHDYPANRPVAVPKEHTIFRFTIPLPRTKGPEEDEKKDPEPSPDGLQPLVFELHGSQFENRPVDRANKKFKWRNVDYL